MAEGTEDLSIVLDGLGDLVAGVAPGQWDDPTPCTEWSVRDLVQHVTGGNLAFADAIRGLPAADGPPADVADSGRGARFRGSAASVLAAFREPDALERVIAVPFGLVPGAVALHLRITEVLVHGWDLARATGQPLSFPEELVERAVAFSRPLLDRIPADRHPFAPPQDVSGEAPAIDRLAALLGRRVAT